MATRIPVKAPMRWARGTFSIPWPRSLMKSGWSRITSMRGLARIIRRANE